MKGYRVIAIDDEVHTIIVVHANGRVATLREDVGTGGMTYLNPEILTAIAEAFYRASRSSEVT